MIRRAVAVDKARVVEMLGDSRIGAGFDKADGSTSFTFPFDPDYAERLFFLHLRGGPAVCIVLDVNGRAEGVLMAVAIEHPFGPVWMAKETVWWIDPAHRGSAAPRMLAEYEMWAVERRCQFVGMAGMGSDPDVGSLYRRRGYCVAETHYLKPI